MNWKRFFVAAVVSILIIGGLLWVSILFLTWTKPLSTALPSPPGDITSVLLAAASLMMVVFGLFVAMAGILGWQGLKDRVVDEAQKATRLALENQYKVGYARLKLSIGTVYGLLAEYLGEERPSRNWSNFFLEMALEQTKVAYPNLAESEYELAAKNNLAFQLALRGAIKDAPEALALARYLREANSKGETKEELLMTYARVIAVFGPSVSEGDALIREAIEIMQNIATSPQSSRLAQEEATNELQRLSRSLDSDMLRNRRAQAQVSVYPPNSPALLARLLFRAIWQRKSARD